MRGNFRFHQPAQSSFEMSSTHCSVKCRSRGHESRKKRTENEQLSIGGGAWFVGRGEKKEKEKRRKSSSMRRKLTRCSLIELVGEPRHAIPLNVCVLRMQHCLKIFSVKRCYIIALTRDFFFYQKETVKKLKLLNKFVAINEYTCFFFLKNKEKLFKIKFIMYI